MHEYILEENNNHTLGATFREPPILALALTNTDTQSAFLLHNSETNACSNSGLLTLPTLDQHIVFACEQHLVILWVLVGSGASVNGWLMSTLLVHNVG